MKLMSSLITALAVGVFSQTGLAQSKGAQTTRVTIDGQINVNPCTGEGVTLYGDLRIVERTELAGDGSLHRHVTVAAQGLTGVGLTTGTQYIVNGPGPIINSVFPLGGNGASVNTVLISSRMVAPGPTEDFSIHILIHTTTDANGVLRASLFNAITECRA